MPLACSHHVTAGHYVLSRALGIDDKLKSDSSTKRLTCFDPVPCLAFRSPVIAINDVGAFSSCPHGAISLCCLRWPCYLLGLIYRIQRNKCYHDSCNHPCEERWQICLVLVKTRAWPIPAFSAQVTHALKQTSLIAVAFTLKNISNCSCSG